MFLPFLQGAQIATHSSCQGNSAECPLECVCCLRCVWAPPGAEYTRAPLLWLPHTSFSSVYPQRSPSICSECRKHTHVSAHCCGRGCGCSSFSVCVCGDCISGKMSKSTLLLFPSSPVTPSPDSHSHAYIHSPPLSATSSSQCEHTLVRTHTFGSWRHTSSCGRLPTHACSYSGAWIDSILIGCLREGGWERREVTGLIFSRFSIWTSVLLLAGEGKDMLSVRVLHMYLNVQEFCLSSVCTHIPPTGKIPNVYISMQKKSIQKAKTGVKIPSLQLIKLLRRLCVHTFDNWIRHRNQSHLDSIR